MELPYIGTQDVLSKLIMLLIRNLWDPSGDRHLNRLVRHEKIWQFGNTEASARSPCGQRPTVTSDRRTDPSSPQVAALEDELARATMERDFALRLLRRQQFLTTARSQNVIFSSYREQNSVTGYLIRLLPGSFKRYFPIWLKQKVKNLLLKIR